MCFVVYIFIRSKHASASIIIDWCKFDDSLANNVITLKDDKFAEARKSLHEHDTLFVYIVMSEQTAIIRPELFRRQFQMFEFYRAFLA